RVNINCAEVNSTRQMGSGIYFFISVPSLFLQNLWKSAGKCYIILFKKHNKGEPNETFVKSLRFFCRGN
ncbi:hypothetical protein, partial [[Clostridium] symbiosum]